MRRHTVIRLLLAVAVIFTLTVNAGTQTNPVSTRPRLVVVVSVDQFRADYLERFAMHFLPAESGRSVGGFRYLMEKGAYFTHAHYVHVPTATGPGHATILSGSTPSVSGIIGNEWFDRASGKVMYCVADPQVQTVGGSSAPMSARNLQVTTIGDELKMATNGAARVVSISFKDRAAVLLAGHAADRVLWFDSGNGAWVTSSYYASDRQLPAWVQALNARKRPDAELTRTWTPLLPTAAYATASTPPFETRDAARVFAHPAAPDGSDRYRRWAESNFGPEYLFETIRQAVQHEGLGADETPDLLAINLATNDYVGHVYGPNSPEVMDTTIRTDRLLSQLFNDLASHVPGGLANVVIVLTADHGTVAIPEEARDHYRLPMLRVPGGTVERTVDAALDERFGAADWVDAFRSPNLYLDRAALAARHVDAAVVERAAADALMGVDGIFAAVTRTQILDGRLPQAPWARMVTNGFNPRRGGDVLVLEAPGAFLGDGTGSGHGSAWSYDSHVPILFGGYRVKPATVARAVSTIDIAPTLASMLGIAEPSGNVGEPLAEALAR